MFSDRDRSNGRVYLPWPTSGVGDQQYWTRAHSYNSPRDIAEYRHIPLVARGVPESLPVEYHPLKGAIEHFQDRCAGFNERTNSASLRNTPYLVREQVATYFAELRAVAHNLHDTQVGDLSHLLGAIDRSVRFLNTRCGSAQCLWFNELSDVVLNESYLALHAAVQSFSPADLVRHRAFVTYGTFQRRYLLALRDSLVAALEGAVEQQLPVDQVASIAAHALGKWERTQAGSFSDDRFVGVLNLVRDVAQGNWTGQYRGRFDNLKVVSLLVQILRKEFEWECWNTPDFASGRLEAEQRLAERLDARRPESLWLWRLRQSNDVALSIFPWHRQIVVSHLPPVIALARVAAQLERRNRTLMPEGPLLRFGYTDGTTFFGDKLVPDSKIIQEMVTIQKERQAKPKGDEAVRGLLGVYEADELTELFNRGTQACFLKAGERILGFYMFMNAQPHSGLVGDQHTSNGQEAEVRSPGALVDASKLLEQRGKYFAELVVQRREANAVVREEFGAEPAYVMLDDLVEAVLRTQGEGSDLEASAICRVHPNPNTALTAHLAQGWKVTGEIEREDSFRFKTLTRLVPGVFPQGRGPDMPAREKPDDLAE